MRMSCHNCTTPPRPGQAYEDTACASCELVRPSKRASSSVFDPQELDAWHEDHPGSVDHDESLHMTQPEVYGADEEQDALHAAMAALGKCVRRLVDLKDQAPLTYLLVMVKLEQPYLSYTDIATQHSVSKQGVFYHFKKAVKMMPELSKALLIDSRFNGHVAKNEWAVLPATNVKSDALDRFPARTQAIIAMKLQDPRLSYTAIARRMGIKVQSVAQSIAQGIKAMPECARQLKSQHSFAAGGPVAEKLRLAKSKQEAAA